MVKKIKKNLFNKAGGKKIISLGNEAVVRGALEAGVNFVSTYPGTPASEIGNIFYRIAKENNIYFEFSTNEKVALEAAAGASLSGLKSLVAMKHFGLNVSLDFLFPLAYTGINGAMVILIADDPSCWSSAQSEEDSRFIIKNCHLPILEPSDPQESKDFTLLAFEISEKFKIPVILRHTTRTSHQSSYLVLGEISKQKKIGKFIKNPHQFRTMPPRVLEQKEELLKKIEEIQKIFEKNQINKIIKNKSIEFGIISSGISYLYAMEIINKLNLEIPILKLGSIYPLPKKKIQKFIKNFKKVLIIEELEPYLETEIKAIAQEINWNGKFFGKDLIPITGELKPEIVATAITKFTNKKLEINTSSIIKIPVKKRSPIFCPGCPYWSVFNILKKISKTREIIIGGEIGCYMLASHETINLQDYLYCMGSDIGIAHGILKSTNQKIIALVGDSSFFHSSIPALINTIFNKSNPLVIILDNRTTAMTGHQPHPGVGDKPIKIEDIVKACGIKNLKIIDQVVQSQEFEDSIKEFLIKPETSVIIARHPCKFVKKNNS